MRSDVSDDEKREKIDNLVKKRNELVKTIYEAVNNKN
jgi:hypothetical protein